MKLRDLFVLLVVSMFFGSSFIFMRVAGPEFGAFPMAAVRLLTGAICLLPWMFLGSRWKQLRENWRVILGIGIFSFAVPTVLFGYAALSLTAGFSAILNATTPLFGSLIAAVWLKERLTLTRVTGLIVGFLGVMTLVGFNLSFKAGGSGWAVVAVLTSTFSYASGATAVKRYLPNSDSIVTCGGPMTIAAMLLIPFGMMYAPSNVPGLSACLGVLGLGIGGSAIAYVLLFALIGRVGPVKASCASFVAPVFAMIFGFLVLDESVTMRMYVGTMVILLGTGLTTGIIQIPGIVSRSSVLQSEDRVMRARGAEEEEEQLSDIEDSDLFTEA